MQNFFKGLKILPRWVIIFFDLLVLACSAILSYLLRFNFELDIMKRSGFEMGVLTFLISGFIAILLSNSYKGIVRYTGLQDSLRILLMLFIMSLIVVVVNWVYVQELKRNVVPYSIILINFLTAFMFLFNYRLIVKYSFSYYSKALGTQANVLIFGAGRSGILTRQVIDNSPQFKVVGFVEDDDGKVGKSLDGIRIYHSRSLEEIIVSLGVDEMVISTKSIPHERTNELVEACLQYNVKVRSVPPVDKWVRGELSIKQIRNINIEDLLGRESIQLNNPYLLQGLTAKKVLITGAAGSIGSELVRQVLRYNPKELVLIDQAESDLFDLELEIRPFSFTTKIFAYVGDIVNSERIERIFSDHQPEILFHAAAYKHVPLMESNPSEAILCNVLGTRNLADLSVKHNVERFVMISTDKAVNPTSVMGCSKRVAEIYVQSLNNHIKNLPNNTSTKFITTRFGNVLGSNGSVILLFEKQIRMGGPVTVTHPEISRYFMTIPEACQLVLEAGTMGNGGEIYIFDMGKPIKILDLANKMIKLSGLEPGKDIDVVFTGLRDGEKLYEELLNNKEDTMPTHHEKILIANVREYSYSKINSLIDLFTELVHDRNELKMVALLKEIVPEFKSNYSRFEALDSK